MFCCIPNQSNIFCCIPNQSFLLLYTKSINYVLAVYQINQICVAVHQIRQIFVAVWKKKQVSAWENNPEWKPPLSEWENQVSGGKDNFQNETRHFRTGKVLSVGLEMTTSRIKNAMLSKCKYKYINIYIYIYIYIKREIYILFITCLFAQ